MQVPRGSMKASASKGPNKQQMLMSLADKCSTYTGKEDESDEGSHESVTSSECEAAMKRPASLKRPAVEEHKHSDRLKKAAWKRAEARGDIPEESIQAHKLASRSEKRSIINTGVTRMPDGSYELPLGKSAVLNQVHHAL